MPIYHPKHFARPETLRTIEPKSLLKLLRPFKSFFAKHGIELPQIRDGKKLDLDQLSAILARADCNPPRDLADALYYINEMSTADGMDALLPELQSAQFTLSNSEQGPADVAVQVWIKNPEIVQRKHAEIFASRPRRFEYFQSTEDPAPPMSLKADALPQLEAYLDKIFISKGRGRGVKVQVLSSGVDGLFIVRHGDPHRREGALDGTEETCVVYRPLKFDIVGYDGGSGALRIFASTKWETSLYRNAFGRYLFGAMDHFPSSERYTLEPLRSGKQCLVCADVSSIRMVYLTELRLRWRGVPGALEIVQSEDVLASMKSRKTEIPPEARIESASFQLFIHGEKQPVRVTILPPNIARYSHEDRSPLIEEWLGLRGFIIGKALCDHEGEEAFTVLQSH